MGHYKTLFNLVQHHKYSLSEVEDMIPFELELYLFMLMEHLKSEEEKLRKVRK